MKKYKYSGVTYTDGSVNEHIVDLEREKYID